MTTRWKSAALLGLAGIVLVGAFAVAQVQPQRDRYGKNVDWFLEIEPKPASIPHDWNRFFPYETDEFNMLHVPDSFEYGGRVVEIVQGGEKARFDVAKEVFLEPVSGESLLSFLYSLHLHAADMVVDEKYTAGGKSIDIAGYSVDTEILSDGRIAGKITLYSGGHSPD